MKKGYVFSLDAFMAVFLTITIFAVLTHSLFGSTTDSFNTVSLKRIMNDSLSILDSKGVLQKLDGTEIEKEINAVMPIQFQWKMKIEEFEFVGSEFKKKNELNLGFTSINLTDKDVVKGRRLFLAFKDNEISKYYNAEYWAWIKNE